MIPGLEISTRFTIFASYVFKDSHFRPDSYQPLHAGNDAQCPGEKEGKISCLHGWTQPGHA